MKVIYCKKILPRETISLYFFITAGIVLRLYYYLLNRSLWIDEVYLSSGIVMKSTAELTAGNLMYYQKAPLFFILAQKLSITLLGAHEYSLRLFPLLCSIASLFFLVPVVKYFLPKNVSWLAIAIMAISAPLIHHSAEAKQYACDFLATSLMLYTYVKTIHANKKVAALWLAVAGAVAIWFSFPVIFILAGIGVALGIAAVKSTSKAYLTNYILIILCWVVSFGISYFFITKKFSESEWTVYWFDYYKYFISVLPRTYEDFTWLPQRLYRMCGYPMGLWWDFNFIKKPLSITLLKGGAVLSFIIFLCGIYSMLKREKKALVLLAPFAFVLLANSIKLYPLGDRFWVFLAPVIAIIIAMGVLLIFKIFKNRGIAVLLPTFLLVGPVATGIQLFAKERYFMMEKRSSQRQALEYIQSHFQNGDMVYIYYTSRPGYKIYDAMYHYPFPSVVAKDYRFESENYQQYFTKMKQSLGNLSNTKRIWFVFNYNFQTDIGEEIDVPKWYFNRAKPSDNIIQWFKTFSTTAMEKKEGDTHVYCFQLINKP